LGEKRHFSIYDFKRLGEKMCYSLYLLYKDEPDTDSQDSNNSNNSEEEETVENTGKKKINNENKKTENSLNASP
jgi:hypothetical protein